jgi:Zn-dependent M16 (insulinase) family peptidase
MLRALTTWLYDGDPFEPLAFDEPLAAIKTQFASDQRYYEKLIERYLLANQHRTTMILEPDPQLMQRAEEAERERLDNARDGMSPAELEALVENTRKLKLLQETPDTPEALATIPVLELSDLEKTNRLIPLKVIHQDGSEILYHDLFTNGIVYLDIGLDIHTLPQELLPYVPLYGRALLEMGTEIEDFVKLSQRIGRTTGGIRSRTYTSNVIGQDSSATRLFLRGKATVDHAQDLLSIMGDVLNKVRLDNRERFLQMLLEEKATRESRLIPAGHQVANTRLRSRYNEADWASEKMGGVEYLFFLRQLLEMVESDWQQVFDNLTAVHNALVNRSTMLHNVTLDADNWQLFHPQLSEYLETLPSFSIERASWQAGQFPKNEGLTIPAQVNYVGKAANLYQLGYSVDGSILPINKLLRTTWLWDRIRVQGGAYGSFCVFDHRSGVFSYLSYRDPNLLETITSFDQTGEFLRKLTLSEQELTKSIIGAIGDMDAYQLPDAKGFTSMARYLSGITDESRQKMRDEVLTTTQKDFLEFADILDAVRDTGDVVVVGSPESIEAANQSRPDWLVKRKLL